MRRTESLKVWAVEIDRKHGDRFLAAGSDFTFFTAYGREAAVAYAKGLRALKLTCRVVRAVVSITWDSKKRRAGK